MDSTLRSELVAQIGMEFGAAHSYLSMSAWLAGQSLDGFASWMRHQSEEETAHGMRILDHLLERGVPVALPAIPEPQSEWGSPLAVAEASLAQEREVTAAIGRLIDTARAAGDHAADLMLQWFVAEQVEEEASIGSLVDRLRLAGDSGAALLTLDAELAARGGEE